MKQRILLISLTVFLILICGHANAQLVNNGAVLSVNKDALLMLNQTDFFHKKGELYLQGLLTTSGNWINEDISTSVLSSGVTGTVEFSGNDQMIGGVGSTHFFNLFFKGKGVKTLGAALQVDGILDLTDREIALESYNLTVTNQEVTSVQRTSGFLSSGSTPGMLIRAMKPGMEYSFPTGSSKNGGLYRPTVLKSKDSSSEMSAALIFRDPDLDGFSTILGKKNGLFDLNTKFYHRIEQLSGNGVAEVQVLFDPLKDGDFKELAFWDKMNWLPSRAALQTGLYGDNLNRKAVKSNFSVKGIQYYALGNKDGDVLFIPNSFSPNGDGKNDFWVIGGIDAFPDNQVRITNRWGDEISNTRSYNSTNAFNGQNLNEGTYYYFISVNINGSMKTYAGYFTLLR